MSRLALFANAMAVAATIAAGSASFASQQPEPPPVLRIATEGAFAPWNATTAAGKLVGFEVDLANDLCRRMRVRCAIVAQDWTGILPGLQQGRYDAVMAGVTVTAERAAVVDFSAAYAADPAVFAVRPGSDLANALPDAERADLSTPAGRRIASSAACALDGKVIAVQASTIHAHMIETLFPRARLRFYETVDAAALDLTAGRVDAMLTARTSVEALRAAGGNLIPAGPAFSGGVLGGGVAVAVRKGDQLSARFTQAIASAAEDGTTARLSGRWFGADLSAK
ncbi:transporter substrate-binding domain-containing protein [Azospirillum sp. YIM B02556]|uniref:Transporter substrate-binding domain-containing protein n=1 Tax=Azospirillum endophyticum TaxID=2800326 RepID=A0ABS1FGA4_9PROT|nr:transporter substrate-binding domain-containing protein [Azospirillum endophyticum]MBK1842449.1 transporter substrate-binding domain-containing protein [Azospirillum endophyticum]